MPELPEVETIKRTLAPLIGGKVMEEIMVFRPEVVAAPLEEFTGLITGQVVQGLDRKGKYLFINLERHTMVFHLRMTGRLTVVPQGTPLVKHTHLAIKLGGDGELRFVDARRFGRVYLAVRGAEHSLKGLVKLGPDALEVTKEAFRELLAERRREIKPLLLDQGFVAGIGNIYADEILFIAGLAPWRRSYTLGEGDMEQLFRSLNKVLGEAIAHGGTTMRDYVDGGGRPGGHQHHLQVYGNEGLPCPRCRAAVKRIKKGGRSTYFCPECQV